MLEAHDTDPVLYKYMEDVVFGRELITHESGKRASILKGDEYLKALNNSKFVLAPKGFSPGPTYRMFDGFKSRSVVISNEHIYNVEYWNMPKEDEHFVSYNMNFKDIEDKILYYFNNPDESQKIANNGYSYYKNNLEMNNNVNNLYYCSEIKKCLNSIFFDEI